MTDNQIQLEFFSRIKEQLSQGISLADDISDVLGLSVDSIYRRLRGETSLSINEIHLLCNHYKISFDSLTDAFEKISFFYGKMYDSHGFNSYLSDIMSDMVHICNSENKKIIYAAIDIPIFHHFKFPVLSAFKMFYWMKAVVNVDYLADKKFDLSLVSDEFSEIGKKIYDLYSNIPSVEIWTSETVNSLVKQIEFYWDSGNFTTKEDAITVCEQAKEQLFLIEKQAEASNKIPNANAEPQSSFMLYNCDIEIGNNCIYTQAGRNEKLYLSVHTFNKIVSENKIFIDDSLVWLNNLTKKSNLISGVSQINRYKFFKSAHDKIDNLINKISA